MQRIKFDITSIQIYGRKGNSPTDTKNNADQNWQAKVKEKNERCFVVVVVCWTMIMPGGWCHAHICGHPLNLGKQRNKIKLLSIYVRCDLASDVSVGPSDIKVWCDLASDVTDGPSDNIWQFTWSSDKIKISSEDGDLPSDVPHK